jgi:hypothetical protein
MLGRVLGLPVAVILDPAHGESVTVNWWNWRPTVALLVRSGCLPGGERAERCLANGCGGHLSPAEALRAAEVVDRLVKSMAPQDRLLLDGSVTDEPKDYSRPVSEWDEETWDHYSASYEWLRRFAVFCRSSGGFEVV